MFNIISSHIIFIADYSRYHAVMRILAIRFGDVKLQSYAYTYKIILEKSTIMTYRGFCNIIGDYFTSPDRIKILI